MPKGTVKWFNNAKGYGFILPEDSEGDIFAHYSAIQMDGYKTLKAGQEVSFEITEGSKGLHAANIQMVSDAGPGDLPAEKEPSEQGCLAEPQLSVESELEQI